MYLYCCELLDIENILVCFSCSIVIWCQGRFSDGDKIPFAIIHVCTHYSLRVPNYFIVCIGYRYIAYIIYKEFVYSSRLCQVPIYAWSQTPCFNRPWLPLYSILWWCVRPVPPRSCKGDILKVCWPIFAFFDFLPTHSTLFRNVGSLRVYTKFRKS